MGSLTIPRLRVLLQRWGVHPDSHKYPAAAQPTRIAPLPPLLVLPLSQHVGAAARPIVAVGDRVLRGQLIAEPVGTISAPLHAATSGRVLSIGPGPVPHASGLLDATLVIEPDGLDEAAPHEEIADPFALSAQDLAHKVAAAGVVGMGGATFPSAVKLALGQRSKVHTLILNGSECEPYLSCDDRLMQERATGVIEGARLIMRATGAEQTLAGIEDNKPEAIAAMRAAAKDYPEVRVVVIPSRYPMGSDRQLIFTLTGLEAPADGRAADVGVVVHNVGTAYAVHRAVRHGEPLIRRYVTVAGSALAEPCNYEVRLGTPIGFLFALCGSRKPAARYLMGGPMMGMVMPSLEVPVIKGTSGVLALTPEDLGDHEPGACIRCSACVKACPVGLMPLDMAAHIRAGDAAGAQEIGLADCIACGSCAYVCPSRIPLVQYFYNGKGELQAQAKEKARIDSTRELTLARSERIEREKQERAEAAARRKAERERKTAETTEGSVL